MSAYISNNTRQQPTLPSEEQEVTALRYDFQGDVLKPFSDLSVIKVIPDILCVNDLDRAAQSCDRLWVRQQ